MSRGRMERAARALTQAMRRETALARCGAIAELAAAADAKQTAWRAFSAAWETRGQTPSEAQRAAIRELLAVADENTFVLDAVRATLDDLAGRWREMLISAADPGLYAVGGRRRRHAFAASLNACV